MSKQIHTMQNKADGIWYNKQDGAERASSTGHKTQAEAIAKAIEIAKNQGLEHCIHGVDGKIREKNSYGNDPRNIKG